MLDRQDIAFRSHSPLKDAIVDPDGELPNVHPPPDSTDLEWQSRISSLPYTGAGRDAIELYRLAVKRNAREPEAWSRIGLSLYDGGYLSEALDAFARLESVSGNSTLRFITLAWQGHLLDLTGRRAEAVAKYKAALAVEGDPAVRHDQYGMEINRKWVEERLATPFKR